MSQENQENKKSNPRYIVLDIVFYASSLNYDQGSGNYQELKKITQWDGSVKIMTSRYALRYSILEHAAQAYPNEWKLAGSSDLSVKSKVVQKAPNTDPLSFPEFDLFGFLVATKEDSDDKNDDQNRSQTVSTDAKTASIVPADEAETEDTRKKGKEKRRTAKTERAGQQEARVSPVKISHAISLNSYNFDSHFTANLGMMKRAGHTGSNPVNMEEFKGFYVFNVTIDINRVSTLDNVDGTLNKNTNGMRVQRIEHLLKTLMYLKRDIKGRREDLSPWLVVAGAYDNMNYDTYMDRIELLKSKSHVIKRKEKQAIENGYTVTEVEHQESSDAAHKPNFKIHDLGSAQIVFKRSDIEIENNNDLQRIETSSKDSFVTTLLQNAGLKQKENAGPES